MARVMAAMSGGVDSSVVAALLKAQGHEVIGATLQLYDRRGPAREGSCCAGRDIEDARAVARKMGFPHYVINAEERFRQSVIEDFAASYARGETPVPCVSCNQGVKFTDLLKLSRDLGCEFMATGHYVRRIRKRGADRAELHRPVDAARDQSWFLFATTQEQLEYLRFPLGEFPNKGAVRDLARQYGLETAAKADSQDICFVTDGSYAAMVEKLRPEIAGFGEIVTENGEVVGRHAGIARYTLGQSRGLGDLHTKIGERQMVMGIEAARRRIVIGPRAKLAGDVPGESFFRRFFLRDVNWLVDAPETAMRLEVQLRAREKTRPATLKVWRDESGGARVEVVLEEAAVPAPGQACVFYEGSRILGGGFILPPAG